MRDSYSFDYIKHQVENRGYTLLSTEYNNRFTVLEVKCPKNHNYKITWDRFRKYNCKKCAAQERERQRKHKKFKQIKQTIEAEGYQVLTTTYQNNKQKLKLICPKGHRCEIRWSSFNTSKVRCQVCWKNRRGKARRHSYKEVVEYLGRFNYRLLSSTYNDCKESLLMECPENHQFEMCFNNFQQNHRCPTCFHKQSGGERDIVNEFNYKTTVKQRNRQIIKPYELDVYFPVQKVAIEYCGLVWHSTACPGDRITPNYHRKKMDLCTQQQIRLLTIFEDEWLNHKDICISRINNALSLVENKIYARNCEVKQIDKHKAKEFLDRTHLQGYAPCKMAYGLFYKSRLVQVMTFGAPARAHTAKGKRVLEMKRLAGELNTVIVGGAGKLFKFALGYIKQYDIIKSYCDLRWGTGNLYYNLGFTKTYESRYTPQYTDRYSRYRNQTLSTNKKKEGITEKEKVEKRQLYTIYDCGHSTWEYVLSSKS